MSSHRPIVLVVRDGWGTNPDAAWNEANAVHLAQTPVDDALMQRYPHAQVITCGEDVGLPRGVTGNSEVGHQNLGAGRIVDQELMRITRTIRDGSFYDNDALIRVFTQCRESGGAVHLMGLCSSAGVHSTLDHVYAILEIARRQDFPGERVFIHCFTDGRDSPPTAGMGYARQLGERMASMGLGRIATIVGRFYAMDRDFRWQRVQRAYDLLTAGVGRRAESVEAAFQKYYESPSSPEAVGDEFIEPTVITGDDGEPVATIDDGDGVIFFNFRGDRPRELVMAFRFDEFPFDGPDRTGVQRTMGFERAARPNVQFTTLTEYQAGLPVNVAFPKPPRMVDTLGIYLSRLGLRQYRIAETEKYPHVTFFFNDYVDDPLGGEARHLEASPRDVTTYDQQPAMSAEAITAALVQRISEHNDDFIVVNYANPDMVGHTGNLAAAIRAVETVDRCVGAVVDAVLNKGGGLIVTADHGNCEQMIDPATGGPHTAHTLFDVELIVVDDRLVGRTLRTGGRLADVAPTILDMLDIERPEVMTGRSLLQADGAPDPD